MAQENGGGALCSTRLDFSCVMHTVTLLAADECVCSGAGFYTPTEDCSGFYQYLTENDPESGQYNHAHQALNSTPPNVCATILMRLLALRDVLRLLSFR